MKHNNACGMATASTISEAYEKALAGDPVSAFGGVLISNRRIDIKTAEMIHTLFCEVVIAPDFDEDALELLKGKKKSCFITSKNV